MRRLRRPALTPPTLCGSGKGATTSAEHVALRAAHPAAALTFPDCWGEADVRGALHAMQGFACAYCNRRLDCDRGEVDHFRPTGGGKEVSGANYWWLAYTFTNYLLACRQCNGRTCKGQRFPLASPSTHLDYANRHLIASEPRLLIDPVEDEVNTWMRVAWRDDEHDDEGLVQIQKHLATGSLEHSRTTKSIEVFRLDRDDDLRQGHIRAVRDALRAMKNGDRDGVHRLACRYLPHGAAAYCVLLEADRSWLPTPKEELLVFLDHLLEKLQRTSELLQRFKTDKSNQRSVQQFLWAFAALWKDPPPGTLTSKEIARWLDDNLKPLKQDIEDKLGKL